MSTGYKTDEKVLKDIINKNIKPKDQNRKINISIYYKNQKTKDLVMANNPNQSQNILKMTNVIYKFNCPQDGCKPSLDSEESNCSYIGHTTTTLSRRLTMHLQQGSIKDHYKNHHPQLTISRKCLEENTKIINSNRQKHKLLISEALYIKHLSIFMYVYVYDYINIYIFI